MRRGAALAAAALPLFAGCTTTPRFALPAVSVGATYKEAQGWAIAQPQDTMPRGAWWEAFGQPVLDDLVVRADAGSPTLAAALARYRQAAAVADATRAALFPVIAAEAAVGRQSVSANRPLARGNGGTFTDTVVGSSASWEADLWGRLGENARAGRLEAAATLADFAGARLSLQASVAETYFDLRGLDAQADLLRQTVTAFARAADLTEARHAGGIASGVDASRAQALLSGARAQLSTVAIERAAAEHRLAVLIGESPSTFSLAPALAPIATPSVPPGTPSRLLERRPDIAAAQRRTAAANARIGVARAAWFPTVTLGLSGGVDSAGGNLLSAGSRFWALGPLSAVETLLDFGRRRADVRNARAAFDQAAATYREVVLDAFREVEDRLSAVRNLAVAAQDQDEATRAAERTRELALTRYRDGASTYLDVVVAQTAALEAERASLTLHTQRLLAAVAINRAIGGGLDGGEIGQPALADAGVPR